jgi:peptidoglycan/xylan/chitin deacetylase (PgdA/CDA1 family)
MPTLHTWPNGKRLALAIVVMFESYSEGKGPSYSVQTTHLKPGTVDRAAISWGSYGGRIGVWRLTRTLNRFGLKATYFTSGRSTELYPEASAYIVDSGHDMAGHGFTQDQLLVDLAPADERAAIRRTLDTIEKNTGKRPVGWLSPVLATTEHTLPYLAEAGVVWQADVNDSDVPYVQDVDGKRVVAIPHSDFMDNRTLRTNARDYFDTYKNAFDYLYANEPGSLLVIGVHCQYGGRPLMTAVFEQVLQYASSFPEAGFTTHAQLAQWVLDGTAPSPSYAERFL